MSKHWTESDFLNHLYEIGPEDNHVNECPECRRRREEWLAARKNITREPDLPAGMLAAQRECLYARMAKRPVAPYFMRWSPAIAVAGVALFVVLWQMPVRRSAPLQNAYAGLSDAQLMTEIYKTVYDSEPDAMEPLHGLFQTKTESKQ
ncbi:MAG: hypothetical protein HYZ37_07055 [Candidatus Solibacter usitatus]|nr:hypothetical protein [Candidatus Solibacter usitatus]